jgi:hypothetical protein
MKHLRNVIWILAIFAIGIQAKAQYVGATVQYVKIKPGQWNNFMELEKSVVEYHQARVEKGIITSWSLYRKKFSGSDEDYQFIWVHQYDDFKKTENANPRELLNSLYTQEELDATMKTMRETREIVRTEHYDGVIFAEGNKPSKYVRLNFFKVKGSDTQDFLKIRKEYVKPVFEQIIEDGHLNSWGLWRKSYYYKDYQFVSADGYSEYGQWKESLHVKEAFDKVKPGEDFDQVGEDMMRTRTLVKSEIWELIESTEPASQE